MSGAIGSFLGTKLGSLVVQPTTQAGALLSSVGSSVGSFVIGSAFATVATGGAASGIVGTAATAIFQTFGQTLGAIVAPGVGAFVGYVLGALIGNLFGAKPPPPPQADAETVLNFDTGYYELGSINQRDGGNVELVRNMAETGRDMLNGMISLITNDSRIADNANTYSPTQTYGHTANQIWLRLGNGSKKNYDTSDKAVEAGFLWAIDRTKVVGGNIYMKRIIEHNSYDQATGDIVTGVFGTARLPAVGEGEAGIVPGWTAADAAAGRLFAAGGVYVDPPAGSGVDEAADYDWTGTHYFDVLHVGGLVISDDGSKMQIKSTRTGDVYIQSAVNSSRGLHFGASQGHYEDLVFSHFGAKFQNRLGFSPSRGVTAPDVYIYRDASGVLALRNALNPQEFRVYERDGGSGDRRYFQTLATAGGDFVVGPVAVGSAVPGTRWNGGIGFYGASPPAAKPAAIPGSDGTTGDNTRVADAILSVLRSYGMIAE